jgi:hypothetical protein
MHVGLFFALPAATAGALEFGEMTTTPCGVRPAACVREAPAGSEVRFAAEADGGDFVVLHADGREERVDVPKVCHAFAATSPIRPAQNGAASATLAPRAIGDGWIESAGVYQMDPSQLIESFTARFTVPPAPTAPQRPETLYYFIGLEDRTQGKLTTIHQPVLTWGDQTEGGLYNDSWHLWSWTCCPKNLTWHSPDIAGFAPGDTIYGSIAKVGADTWRIDSAWQDAAAGDAANGGSGAWHNTTLTSQVGGYNYNYADVTLEVYNLTSCEQMSTGSVAFTDLVLRTSGGTRWTPSTWYPSGFASPCEISLKIESPTAMTITVGSK